ncbi:hypothetical protein [Lysinibacillus sp.]|uniref:hypothetical protein n=1 Tax=Lysinibacillus sp. TaxID=1869345 RepID=UPI00289CE3C4|nr:hypothetical protein [Lysinibacillus sp.]
MNVEWGNIADWVSGLGSIFAAIIALYFGTRDNRIKLDIQIMNDKFRSFENAGHGNTYDVCITNLRVRTVHIRSIGLYKRTFLKKKSLSKATNSDQVLLASLTHGDMTTKKFDFNKANLKSLTGLGPNELKNLYIGIEDISGKIHYKKFTP